MDAPISGAVTNVPLQQPTMWITRDAETMQRAHNIVSDYSVAFFDVQLLGGGSRRYPEVVFEKHR